MLLQITLLLSNRIAQLISSLFPLFLHVLVDVLFFYSWVKGSHMPLIFHCFRVIRYIQVGQYYYVTELSLESSFLHTIFYTILYCLIQKVKFFFSIANCLLIQICGFINIYSFFPLILKYLLISAVTSQRLTINFFSPHMNVLALSSHSLNT